MKKSIILFLILASALAFGQWKKGAVDTLQFGIKSSATDKGIIFETNAGAANPKLEVETVSKMLKYDKNLFRIGDGAPGSKEYRFDTSGTDAALAADFNTGDLTYNKDNFTLGAGADENIRYTFDNGSGAANPYIGYSSVTQKLIFNNGTGENLIGGSESGNYDHAIGLTGDFLDLSVLEVSGTAGESAFVNSETVSGSVTFSKSFGITGGGFNHKLVGSIIIGTGSDGLSITNIRFGGGVVIIQSGVKNVRITECWVDPDFLPQDNSGNTSNKILCTKEE